MSYLELKVSSLSDDSVTSAKVKEQVSHAQLVVVDVFDDDGHCLHESQRVVLELHALTHTTAGKPSATDQPTRPTQPFILFRVDKSSTGFNWLGYKGAGMLPQHTTQHRNVIKC